MSTEQVLPPRAPTARDPFGAPPPPPPEGAGLQDVGLLLRRRGLVVLIATLVGVGLALLASQSEEERFQSRSSLLFAPPATAPVVGQQLPASDQERSGTTRSELLALDQQARRTARELGLTPDVVRDAVEIDARSDADVVDIVVTTDDPRLSARIANAYAQQFIAFRERTAQNQIERGVAALSAQLAALDPDASSDLRKVLRDQIAQLQAARALQTGDAELVQRAVAPLDPLPSALGRNLVIGALGGLLLGFAIASSLQRADRRVRTADELEQVYGARVLAEVPRSRTLRRRRLASGNLPAAGREVEAFRALRAGLRAASGRSAMRIVLVVSPGSGEGKSTVAEALALTMAAMGDRVVLVDADLRKSDGDAPGGGLAGVLHGRPLEAALGEHAVGQGPADDRTRTLTTLPSGPAPEHPAELLEGVRMERVLDELIERFDVVIVDTVALGPFSDALALVPRASGVVVVGALGRTRRDAARMLRRELTFADAPVVGAVANLSRRKRTGAGAYYS